jgi:hypothetical protein
MCVLNLVGSKLPYQALVGAFLWGVWRIEVCIGIYSYTFGRIRIRAFGAC